ncbi:hypothetical protein ERICIV_02635 [Paenibacillus larvae subsp. larvae]|uniref:Uncharacterized protein n=2 Tax=Paenibacillus larvae TaxID=1464 RepID=A0A1U9YTC5_9BACL|nr:hypothetical protein B1222_02740 [Paenibacillus larvae subsp. pulvifaciens]AQZ48695.1 hypothetical protein B5S25_21105 [Paenibacillus larvae subsp. pulvifaciens]ARF69994.1 hypothetical protein B7C51_22305 [Paenibacillus larvae subsp. pulvifaciens]AVF26782.1 hypothetical protein ERICIII_02646 [Paenibacillus larvae subsp. larvae]AVF31529.1 hypothetical protein ERICIV_02635 [Paenibacillus larvae subsp. larvae]
MGKYVGKTVEIIYLDRKGQITQRKVQIRSIHGSMVRAYCMLSKSVRTFKLENILAMHPVMSRHAV